MSNWQLSPKFISSLVKTLWIGFIVLFVFLALHIMAVAYNWFGLYGGMPSLDNLTNPKNEIASVVYSSDGKELGKYFRENRVLVTYEQLSPNLIKALYATEDIRFDEHSGIDLKGLASVGFYLVAGKRRGSSTLTQQLAKNLFDTRSELYEGPLTKLPVLGILTIKTKEWLTAIRLEKSYTKKEILLMYLNTVDFGSNAFGIYSGAKTFFATTPDKVTVPQAAMLVGVLKAQSLYSPVYKPENALRRRNTVIDQMLKYDFLTAEEAISYQQEPLRLTYKVENSGDGLAPHFRAELRKDLLAFCRENGYDLFSDGLKIYTTIDSRIQAHAEAATRKHMEFLQKRFFNYFKGRNPWLDEQGKEIKGFLERAVKNSPSYKVALSSFEGNEELAWQEVRKPKKMRVFTYKGDKDTLLSVVDSVRYYKNFLRSGLLSVEPSTGYIKAWVGGVDFRYFKYDHVRQGRRQPGSSFKPFLYTVAIDNGMHPCDEELDGPVTYTYPDGKTWSPKNSDGSFSGEKMSLRKAIGTSINSIAARLIIRYGPEKVVEYARKLGIESPLDPVMPLALGTSDVSLYEMAGAYSVFANKGNLTKPYYIVRIEDKRGNILREYLPESKQVLNEESAYLMLYMLQGATRERNGTALGLYRLGNTLPGNEIAAKTGTTSNYSDGWFFGITKQLLTGVWVGGEERSIHFHTSADGQGARMAMPIWSYFMDAVYNDKSIGVSKGPFERPKTLSVELDCKKRKLGQDTTLQKNIPDAENLLEDNL